MIALGSPAWLAGLALVPLIRFLHQWRGLGPTRVVPAAFLWRDAASPSATGARRAPPDPAWRRRALATVLLVLTLAAPGWPTGDAAPLEVLVDNRPSLLTREANGQRRIDQAARALNDALAQETGTRVRLMAGDGRTPAEDLAVRSLADLTRTLERMTMTDLDPGPAIPPLPGSAHTRRWLVSDGAAGVKALGALGPWERVWPLGSETENQGITRLAARPALETPDLLEVLAAVHNAGDEGAVRTFTLSAGGRHLGQATLRLPAGATLPQTFQVAWNGEDGIEARLEPADALEADDAMTLGLGPVAPIALQVVGDCPPSLESLIAAHPALYLNTQDPVVRVWCAAGEPPDTNPPTLWLPPGEPLEDATGPLRWAARELARTPADRLLSTATAVPIGLMPPPVGETLLSRAGHPVVIEQAGGRRLVGLFATGPAAAGSPGVPLLLDWLLGRLIGRDLLFPATVSERAPEDSRVAPGPLPAAVPRTVPEGVDRPRIPLWPWPLIAAIGVLWIDLRRLPAPAPHEPLAQGLANPPDGALAALGRHRDGNDGAGSGIRAGRPGTRPPPRPAR